MWLSYAARISLRCEREIAREIVIDILNLLYIKALIINGKGRLLYSEIEAYEYGQKRGKERNKGD